MLFALSGRILSQFSASNKVMPNLLSLGLGGNGEGPKFHPVEEINVPAARQERTMGNAYTVVLATLLLFPWSLVGLMLGGSVWQRIHVSARGHRSCR